LKKTKQKHLAPNFVSDERKNDDIPPVTKKKKKKTKKLNWELKIFDPQPNKTQLSSHHLSTGQ